MPSVTTHRQIVKCQFQLIPEVQRELDLFRQSLKTRLIKESLIRATNQPMKQIAAAIPRGSGPALRKNGTPRPRLADSLVRKSRRYKDGTGFYVIIGLNSSQPHAHLVEAGTELRFRKRIGGKFAYLEPLESIYRSDGNYAKDAADARARRTTGWMPASHVFQKAAEQTAAQVRATAIMFLSQKIMRKATRVEQGDYSVAN